MGFLTSFVFVALIMQVVALVLLALSLGSQALHRALYQQWQRLSGRRRPGSNHGS